MTTRDRMIDAAAHVMRTRGLAHATTKEIARTAGYSEAALYKHFRDKTDLFLAVLSERTPDSLATVLGQLRHRVGRNTVQQNLQEVARAAMDFYHHNFPMAVSLFSDPELLAAHREALRRRDAGPANVGNAVSAYLVAERDLGRVRPDADPQAASALLLGACFQHAFLGHFTDEQDDSDSRRRLAAALAATLTAGLTHHQAGDHQAGDEAPMA